MDQVAGTVLLDAVIQHTPRRDTDPVYLELRRDLEDSGLPTQVVCDPAPTDDYAGTWRTYQQCLRAPLPEGTTHRLIFQDDVELCDEFRWQAQAAVEARPYNLLAFFASWRPGAVPAAVRRARRCRWAWAVHPGLGSWVPAQAIAWPVELLEPMASWDDEYVGWKQADDERIARWAHAHHQTVLLSVPSLVEHVHHGSTTLVRQLDGKDTGGKHRAGCCVLRKAGKERPLEPRPGELPASYAGRLARGDALGDWPPSKPIEWRRGPGIPPRAAAEAER